LGVAEGVDALRGQTADAGTAELGSQPFVSGYQRLAISH
jgi:hypothetical protein